MNYEKLFLKMLQNTKKEKSNFKLNIFKFKLTKIITKLIKNIFMNLEYQIRKVIK